MKSFHTVLMLPQKKVKENFKIRNGLVYKNIIQISDINNFHWDWYWSLQIKSHNKNFKNIFLPSIYFKVYYNWVNGTLKNIHVYRAFFKPNVRQKWAFTLHHIYIACLVSVLNNAYVYLQMSLQERVSQ